MRRLSYRILDKSSNASAVYRTRWSLNKWGTLNFRASWGGWIVWGSSAFSFFQAQCLRCTACVCTGHLDLWPSDVTASASARNKEKKYCSMGKISKQHLLVRGAKDSDFKVSTSLNFVPFNFLLTSFAKQLLTFWFWIYFGGEDWGWLPVHFLLINDIGYI